MITTADLAVYLDTLLGTATTPDYSTALNGLQLQNSGRLSKLAAAVDFSSAAISGAIEQRADTLLVHHGMFWAGLKPYRGAAYRRLKQLIDNDIAVYSSHLPLDRHPVFGNNVLLCQQLGLDPSGEFASFKDSPIGLSGESDIATSELFKRVQSFASTHLGVAVSSGFSPEKRTRRWGLCTGGGASTESLEEAVNRGLDTIVVGEGPHHTAVDAREEGITVIYAGHYATETLGVAALASHLAEKFDLEWTMIDAPTGL
ncbi:MAG: Nif3-like dinuclear metal center hexameric protein [Gemmatimonadaceae bacterium]